MESRLPKPKFTSTPMLPLNTNSKTKSTEELTTKKSNKVEETQSIKKAAELEDKSKTEETKTEKTMFKPPSTSNLASKMKNAKSTHDLTKNTNENKMPARPTITRSKTLSTITRSTVNNKALKRPGDNINSTVEPKKPNIKTGVQADNTKKPAKNVLSHSATNKTNTNGMDKPTMAKPNKWDLKGQLAYKTEELNIAREKFKDVNSKNTELQQIVDELQANDGKYKNEAEKYKIMNESLLNELKVLKSEITDMTEKQEKLTNDLCETKKSLEQVSENLKECQEKYSENENLLKTQTIKMQQMEGDLEKEKKLNKKLSTTNGDLQSLVHKLDQTRRVLHNTIQELKGNIRVFCRVRPRTLKEENKPLCTINFVDECTIEVGKSDGSDSMSCSGKSRGIRQEFSFDKVFSPNASQADVFEELSLLVQSAIEGYNVCVFAYGQTGSGKTYTMEGQPGLDTEGVIPRTVHHIFNEMKQFELLGWEYKIEASFLEIYNEHIVDLLDSHSKTHEIRMKDSKGNDLYVSNLKIEEIHSPEELHNCLLTAQRNRAVAATSMNERSSRSHSVARIQLTGTHTTRKEMSIGNLYLVDLAGSERLKNEEAARTTETKNINKSLANLGNVILALLKKQEHVPYRNSKLTHLLMPSLGGNSKTLMFLNISPLDECYNETLNSLRFASNVNNCKINNAKRVRTIVQN